MPQDVGGMRHREELVWLVPVAAMSIVIFVGGQLAGAPYGIDSISLLGDYAWKALRLLPLLVMLMLVAMMVRAILSGAGSPLRALAAPLRTRFGTPWLALAGLAPLALMFSGYGAFKLLLPLYAPFSWDDAFAAADRILFLGQDPWRLTHALFGSFEATLLIDRIYTFWILLLSLAIVGFSLFASRYDRARFFLAFTVAWIVGLAGAYLGSSAGPCYTALVGAASASDFAPLMERLRDYSETRSMLGAVQWQEVLWNAHANRQYGFGMGISAMPSLHNAIAVLYALALARFGRGFAIGGWLFALVIFLGSIHLGWHYAIDGVVAAIGMIAIWRGAGHYLARRGYAPATWKAAEGGSPEPAPALA